jgi:hypothetical protein
MLAKKIALGFGIALILPMMIHYGVSTFSPSPDHEEYRIENYQERHERASEEEQKQLESRQQRLQEQYERSRHRFETHLFFVAVPLGIAAILTGAFVAVPAIGTGLMLGGILSITNGYLWFWSELGDPWRFGSLAVALVVLVAVGYRKLDRR